MARGRIDLELFVVRAEQPEQHLAAGDRRNLIFPAVYDEPRRRDSRRDVTTAIARERKLDDETQARGLRNARVAAVRLLHRLIVRDPRRVEPEINAPSWQQPRENAIARTRRIGPSLEDFE